MKKLGKLLNYQSRLLQEKKKKELRTLKKHPKQMFKGSKIRTLKTILILGRISKSLPLVNSKMLEETTQMISISEEMRKSYLDYAMSVIVSRALPDVRDGLKPVHRRILYSMYDYGPPIISFTSWRSPPPSALTFTSSTFPISFNFSSFPFTFSIFS